MKKNNAIFPKSSKRRQHIRGSRRPLLFTLVLIASVVTLAVGSAWMPGKISASRVNQTEGAASPQEFKELSANAVKQLETLAAMKKSLTPTQKKIDSQLIFATKQETGEMAALGLDSLQVDVKKNDAGKVLVDITADVTETFLARLRAHGGNVVSSVPNLRSVRAEVALSQLEAVAAVEGVKFIQPAQEAATAQEPVTSSSDVGTRVGDGTVRLTRDLGARAAQVQESIGKVLATSQGIGPDAITPSQDTFPVSVNNGTGPFVSEGEKTHQVGRARGTFNVNGAGLKIGVLSNGVGGLAEAQARGELPQVTVLPGQFGPSGSEGTAMLEIVHDIAPGAQLYFATAFTGPAAFAQNIRDLRAAGCDIIVDDVFYFLETPFQDGQAPAVVSNTLGGVVAQAVIDVTTSGALYFSSAGNQGNMNDGTAGVWEGDFNDGGNAPPALFGAGAGRIHLFTAHPSQPAPPTGPLTNNQIVLTAAAPINLFWSDPLGGSANDYDLWVTNSAGTALVAASTNSQDGTQDPAEQIPATANVTNNRIVITKFVGAVRYLHLNTNGARTAFNTPGQTKGHSTAALAYSTAATPAIGPYPAVFNATNTVETFSSDGPRRLFYQSDGTPFTVGNVSSTGGTVRQKPDVTAADGVSVTGVAAFGNPFFGTSAAAPHAAAIAALLKQAVPGATQAQIRTALNSSAIDIEAPGTDRDSGTGIIDAFAALQALGATSFSNQELLAVTPAESGGNGNGFIESGEAGTLNILLENTGVQIATGITATLTTSTPGVGITSPGTRTFPGLGIQGVGTNSSPYSFAVGGSCSPTIDFTLTIASADRPSPKVINFTLFTGRGANISTSLDAAAAPSGALFTAVSGTQAGRLVRDGVEQTCGPNKLYPGVNDNSNRRYDAYTFPNTSSSAACVTVRLYSPLGINLQPVAYGGTITPSPAASFNSTSAAAYLGEAGTTGVVEQFSVRLPANTNLTVVVNDVPTGVVTAVPYTLEVTGLNPPCAAALTVNQPPVNTVPAAQSVVQNSQLVFSTGNGNAISIADPDANGYPVQQTLTATNGTLSLSSNAGLTFSVGTGFDNSTMTFTGTIADINSALQGLTYRPNFGFNGAASLTVTTNDQGFLGSGGAKSDTDVVPITVTSGSAFKFDSGVYLVGESDGQVVLTVLREGNNSTAASIQFATSNQTASDRSDYGAAYGTLNFAPGQFTATFPVLINEDSLVEGVSESFLVTLSNPQGTNVALGLQPIAVVVLVDNASEPATNAIDDSTNFVEQHYHDFLNREPDAAGLAFWVNNIESCGANPACREVRRIDTSAAFFLSIEFQQTGYFAYRSYAAALGTNRIGGTVPLTLLEFLADTQQIGKGVVILNPGADAVLESNKQAYLLQFVQRTAFTTLYPPATTPANLVDALNTNTGNSLTMAQRNALVAQLTANNTTQGRADVLRAVVDNVAFQNREFNRAFVLMQYFGYLRRNPNDAPDTDFAGFTFWLTKLNAFNGDFRNAEMVKAFITSSEYRKRFGLN